MQGGKQFCYAEGLGNPRHPDDVVTEGTVDEKRRFIRAFVHQVVVEPGTLQARIALRDVPLPAV